MGECHMESSDTSTNTSNSHINLYTNTNIFPLELQVHASFKCKTQLNLEGQRPSSKKMDPFSLFPKEIKSLPGVRWTHAFLVVAINTRAVTGCLRDVVHWVLVIGESSEAEVQPLPKLTITFQMLAEGP